MKINLPVVIALGLILLARLFLPIALYHAGFEGMVADDFIRICEAGHWARQPHFILPRADNCWTPFHKYLYGLTLLLRNNLLLAPRGLTILLGAVSIGLIYLVTRSLFKDPAIGIVSALLLAVNPAHLWLSSTPLAEIPNLVAVLAFFLAFISYLRNKGVSYLYLSAFMLGIANSIRYESWAFSLVFSLFLIGDAIREFLHNGVTLKKRISFIAALIIPWLFPLFWLSASYIIIGNPLHNIQFTRNFEIQWFGVNRSYRYYLKPLLKIDPYAAFLGVAALLACLFRYRKERAVRWYVILSMAPFLIFAFLQRGQATWETNLIRYLSLFVFLTYPALAFLLNLGITAAARSPRTRRLLLVLVLALITATQTYTAFSAIKPFSNLGLKVGEKIRALRGENPDLADRPILIEASSWKHFVVNVGANDITSLLYDRPVRTATSLLRKKPLKVKKFLREHRVSFIVVNSPELVQTVKTNLGLVPFDELDGFVFFEVPSKLQAETPIAR